MDFQLMKAIAKGILTYVPIINNKVIQRKRNKLNHSGSNAIYCYTLWMKILNFLLINNRSVDIKCIAEIGTGGSLGLGICALLTGAEQYTALDIEEDLDVVKNLQLLNEIVDLFKSSKRVPSHVLYDQLNVKIDGFEYYNQVYDQSILDNFQSSERIEEIRKCILLKKSNLIQINNNWMEDYQLINRFDFVFSRAVMEHVNKPDEVYHNLNMALKINGLMFHDIEFHSHGITKDWNTHKNINENIWRIIKGKRPYFLNRYEYIDHYNMIQNNNFKIVDEIIIKKQNSHKLQDIYGVAILSCKNSKLN